MPENLRDEGMAEGVNTIPPQKKKKKKGNVKQYQNYLTISLISHPSKTVLRVMLSRLPRLRNCWQKTKQVLDQVGAQLSKSPIVRVNIVFTHCDVQGISL